MKRAYLVFIAVAVCGAAHARDSGPSALCETWPDAIACTEGVPACTTCHLGIPTPRNAFGADVESRLGEYVEDDGSGLDLRARFAREVGLVLPEVEGLDSDGDGFTNRAEMIAGTSPGDDTSFPIVEDPCEQGSNNPHYNVCGYDHDYAFKRLHLDVCGYAPSYTDVVNFSALGLDEKETAIADALAACLDSEHWVGRDGVLWGLAHAKIRPIAAIKANDPGEEFPPAGPVPLGNYTHDYALFAYTQTDDRDARDVLVGDYFVQFSENPTAYTRVNGFPDQRAAPDRRAGMITTRWFFVINTMFTPIPRTTAAQAYRAYLGLDIARSEGIGPAFEPDCELSDDPNCGVLVDYDDKGVTSEAPDCAGCHRTLDPLSYPFSRYNGIQGGVTGAYNPGRMLGYGPDQGALINETPEAGAIFGQPVADLMEWAQVAANSDQFARATVATYWRLLVGHDPTPGETAEFDALWRAFMDEHDYRIERMLLALIETEAYGVP